LSCPDPWEFICAGAGATLRCWKGCGENIKVVVGGVLLEGPYLPECGRKVEERNICLILEGSKRWTGSWLSDGVAG